MQQVSDKYKQLATGKLRKCDVEVRVYRDGSEITVSGADVISVNISKAQTNAGFSVGATFCASCSLVVSKTADITYGDKFRVRVGFSDSEGTEWNALGYFYVDKIKIGKNSVTITAYDIMLQLGSKEYVSALTYPVSPVEMLAEIAQQAGVSVSADSMEIGGKTKNIYSAPCVTDADGTISYYTYRTVLGYLACMVGGICAINSDNELEIRSLYTNALIDRRIYVDNVIDFQDNNTSFTVEALVWNKGGEKISLKQDAVGVVEFVNNLDTPRNDVWLLVISSQIVGRTFNGATIKMQGNGILDIGEIVYFIYNSKTYTLYTSSISYSIKAGGSFVETVTSVAESPSQQQYRGEQSSGVSSSIITSQGSGNVAIIDHAPTESDLLGRDRVIVQYDPNDEESVIAENTLAVLYRAVNVFVEKSKIIVPTYVYGVEWSGTGTLWTRTDDSEKFPNPSPYFSGAASYSSPFDTLQPWAGMTKSVDSEAGVLVSIPKFWYRLTQNGKGMKIQIATKPATGFSVSPAHMDRGDGFGERDVIYVGRYHCSSADYKSTSGVKPKVSMTRAAARNAIHNLGSSLWQMDFATRFTIWLLYLVEFADWDSQSTIGGGCSETSATSSGVYNSGATDSMPYHTGTVSNSHSAYGACQYRNIEDLWGNVVDWFDGCYYNSNGLNIILNPSSFSDSSGGALVGKTHASGGRYATGFTVSSSGGYTVFFCTANSDDRDNGSTDHWGYNAAMPTVWGGGTFEQSDVWGLFQVGGAILSKTDIDMGARIVKL